MNKAASPAGLLAVEPAVPFPGRGGEETHREREREREKGESIGFVSFCISHQPFPTSSYAPSPPFSIQTSHSTHVQKISSLPSLSALRMRFPHFLSVHTLTHALSAGGAVVVVVVVVVVRGASVVVVLVLLSLSSPSVHSQIPTGQKGGVQKQLVVHQASVTPAPVPTAKQVDEGDVGPARDDPSPPAPFLRLLFLLFLPPPFFFVLPFLFFLFFLLRRWALVLVLAALTLACLLLFCLGDLILLSAAEVAAPCWHMVATTSKNETTTMSFMMRDARCLMREERCGESLIVHDSPRIWR